MASGVRNSYFEGSNRFGNSLLRGGIYLLLAGLAVLLVPEILITLVAAALMLAGAGLLILSRQLKKSAHRQQNVRIYIS